MKKSLVSRLLGDAALGIGVALVALMTNCSWGQLCEHASKSISTDPVSGIRYEDLFCEALHSTNPPVRYACGFTLAGSSPRVEDFLSRVLGKLGDEQEQELAALILLDRKTPSSLVLVAPFYVQKLQDPHYTFKDITGSMPYRAWEIWGVTVQENGRSEKRDLRQRHVAPIIEKIGKAAVPHLVVLLREDDLELRMNAFVLLERITKLKIPFDVVTGQDSGVKDLLIKNGWLVERVSH